MAVTSMEQTYHSYRCFEHFRKLKNNELACCSNICCLFFKSIEINISKAEYYSLYVFTMYEYFSSKMSHEIWFEQTTQLSTLTYDDARFADTKYFRNGRTCRGFEYLEKNITNW